MTTDSSVTLDIVPANGGIAIDEATINVVTTCRSGYNLTLATPNGSNLYLNGDGTGTAAFTAVNGTSTLADSTNKWGYTLTANASSSTVFSPLSATETTLKTASQTASQTDIDDTFSIYYGAKADNSVTPGSYKMANNGALVYYLTMDASCYTVDITYDGNNADAGNMASVVHSDAKDGDTITLVASNFSRSGYGFAGWSFDSNAGAKLVDNDNTNNPVVYGPQEDVTLPTGFTNYDTDNDGIVKLYAVWIQSQGNLQGWMGCSNLDTAAYDSNTGALDLTKNSITALTDQRDNDTYAVARLADGNCWMIENLRLDNNATTGNNQTDSTVTNEWLAEGYGKFTTYGNFVGLANSEDYDFDSYNRHTANSIYYYGDQSGTAFINVISAKAMPRYNNLNTSARASDPHGNTFNDGRNGSLYSYGNYYTWPAAIADLAPNRTTNQSTIGTSLCPAGWHLPTGGMAYASGNTGGINVTGDSSTFRDFYNLGYALMGNITAYESNAGSGFSYYKTNTTNPAGKTALAAFSSFPNNFLLSGYYRSEITGNGNGFSGGSGRGTTGYYWTSTAYYYNNSSEGSFVLSLLNNSSSSGYIYPGTSWENMARGRTIRCLASNPTNYTLSYSANGGSGAPSSQTVYNNGSASFTVSNTVPTRSGYTFAGWTDEKGSEVQPGGTFKTKDTNAVLYAIWTNNSCNPTATTIGTGNASTDAVCLQDVKPGMKTSLLFADSTTGTFSLIDARDGQSYTVAKLADGELWLTKNLNYGNNSDLLLTSYDTDLPSGKAFKAPATTTSFETANNDDSYVSPKILTDNTYGGYYSFAAAIASTETYSNSSQSITTSICPKGWDLPTNTQYDNLRSTSGNTTFAKMSAAPYSFIYAGYRNGTSFTSQTSAIRLWTSTNYSAPYVYYTTAYGLATYSSNYKRYGESVRCVASNGTATVNYNANGGSGTMASQTGEINTITIKSNSFTAPTNSRFKNWNTRADGTGVSVAPNALLSSVASDGDTITLYAQWDELYYITFNANESSVDSSATATGTMTNQTVVRGVATAIQANAFALTGYIFYGWNTSADGTGAFYSDGQKVTNLTSTGNTITLYAVWVKEALLDTGTTVNRKLKRLAGNSSATYSTQDTSITALARSSTLPNGFTPSTDNTISVSSSPFPIYAWFDSTDGTIYYYSEANTILMNGTSSYFFQAMMALSDLATISTWDTTRVTNMSYMFYGTGDSVTTFTLDLSSWNTSGVTDMSYMFSTAGYNASTFTLNLSSWNTSSVTNMSSMFENAGHGANTWSVSDLSSWDTSSVGNMRLMFSEAGYSATTFTLNLSSWNNSSVTDMSYMFFEAGYNATTFTLDVSSWDTSSVIYMTGMFSFTGHSATTFTLGLSSWNTSSVKRMDEMFSEAGYNATTFTLDVSSWDTSSVTYMSGMFGSAGYSATTWSIGDLSAWKTSNVTDMSGMFGSAGYSATTWSIGDLSAWKTSNVTDMSGMFSFAGYSATTWSVGDLSSWNTSSVTDMYAMFYGAGYSATTFTLDLSSWNTSSVTNMSNMFYHTGYVATTWSITIPKTNDGTASGPITNTTSNLYGQTTSVTATPDSGRSFTLAN